MNIATIIDGAKKTLLWIGCKSKPLFYKSLETFFASLGVFMTIVIVFCIITYMPLNSFSRPLIKIFAKQVGTNDPYVIEMINNGIKDYAKQYEEQITEEVIAKKASLDPDEFSRLLYQLELNSYHRQLQRNLVDLKPIIDQEQYSILQSLYSDLLLFWAKLYNGVYGTDTAKAFNDYYDVISKYKCQKTSLHKEVYSFAKQKFPQDDKAAQTYFRQLYSLPLDALIFEINLRTLAMTPKEADEKLKSTGKYIFDITRENSYISVALLESSKLCK